MKSIRSKKKRTISNLDKNLLSTRNKIPSARNNSLCYGIPSHSFCSPSEFYRQNHLLSSVTDDETLNEH